MYTNLIWFCRTQLPTPFPKPISPTVFLSYYPSHGPRLSGNNWFLLIPYPPHNIRYFSFCNKCCIYANWSRDTSISITWELVRKAILQPPADLPGRNLSFNTPAQVSPTHTEVWGAPGFPPLYEQVRPAHCCSYHAQNTGPSVTGLRETPSVGWVPGEPEGQGKIWPAGVVWPRFLKIGRIFSS